MKFGWLNDKGSFETDTIRIRPLVSIDDAINSVIASSQHDGIWCYPSIVYKTDESSPKVVVGRYELPSTHEVVQKIKPKTKNFLNLWLYFMAGLTG